MEKVDLTLVITEKEINPSGLHLEWLARSIGLDAVLINEMQKHLNDTWLEVEWYYSDVRLTEENYPAQFEYNNQELIDYADTMNGKYVPGIDVCIAKNADDPKAYSIRQMFPLALPKITTELLLSMKSTGIFYLKNPKGSFKLNITIKKGELNNGRNIS